MFKYIAILSIISFCHAGKYKLGDYEQLVLSQQLPQTVLYALQKGLQNRGVTLADTNAHLINKVSSLMNINKDTWMVTSLTAMDSAHNMMSDCHDRHGRILKYSNMRPQVDFRNRLLKYWPSTSIGLRDDANWEAHFDFSGCCIREQPTEYFQYAMSLHDRFNLHTILRKKNIKPGHSYPLSQITDAITKELAKPNIKCQQSLSTESTNQYLLEIQICLNSQSVPVDCEHTVSDPCFAGDLIYYPPWK